LRELQQWNRLRGTRIGDTLTIYMSSEGE